MTHTPAVDSLERVVAEIRQCRSIMGTVADDLMDAWANRLEALTRPPGGSERLRELVAKWRERASVLYRAHAKRTSGADNWSNADKSLVLDCCADELDAILTTPEQPR